MINTFLLSFLLSYTNPAPLIFEGQKAIDNKQWENAVTYFETAIDTGMLNTLGMTTSYWNIYLAEDKLGHTDNSMTALLGFLSYGYEVYTQKDAWSKKWAKRFRLKFRLDYGFAVLQAKWAARNKYSCRSRIFACYIDNKKLISVFAKTIPFCSSITSYRMNIVSKDRTIITNIKCMGENNSYYFITK